MNVSRTQLKTWFVRISLTGGAQAAIQALGLLAGLLVIRTLNSPEYAYYTITNAVLGTLGMLCDSGIITGVAALSAKVWQDPAQLGCIYLEGMRLRRLFAFIGLAGAIPAISILLHQHGASLWQIVAISGSLIPTFYCTITGQLHETSLRLHQRLRELQVTQLATAASRVGMLAACLPVWPSAAIAIVASGAPQLWANYTLRKKAAPLLNLNQPPAPAIRRELWGYIRKILPGSIYYALSGQISIWLITIFGNSQAVADVGAASRLTMILNVVSMVFGLLITPRFARLPPNHPRLHFYYYAALIAVGSSCLLLISPFVVFPHTIDLVLGSSYSNIHSIVYLSFLNYSIGLIEGSIFMLRSRRGLIVNQLMAIPLYVLSQGLLIFLINPRSAAGALIISCAMGVIRIFVNVQFTKLK